MTHKEGEATRGLIEVVAEIEGIKLYGDEGVRALTEAFDPTTYRGPHFSRYGDNILEQRLSPLAALGKSFGQYAGVERASLNDLIRRTGGIFTLGKDEAIPDVRTETMEGTEVYFPTEALLEGFFVQRRPLPQE